MHIIDDKQELIDIVNSIRSRIDQYNIQCKVLPAFGICINHNNMDVSLMCDYADLAIKKIKGKVFKTYEFYDNAMRESMLLEKKIENDVLPALKNDYIKHMYSLRLICTMGILLAERHL